MVFSSKYIWVFLIAGLVLSSCNGEDIHLRELNKGKEIPEQGVADFAEESSNISQLDHTLTQNPWLVSDSQFQNTIAQGGVFEGQAGCPTLKSPSSGSHVAWLLNQTDGYGVSSGCLPNKWSVHGSGYRSNSSMRQLIVNDSPGAGIAMTSKDFWGGRCRNDGEGWPHFLFEQQFAGKFSQNQLIIGNNSEIFIHLDFKVNSVTKYSCHNYDSGKHAAQFLATIKLDHVDGGDHGLWIQLPIYDNRIAQTREYFQNDQHGTPTFVIEQAKFRSSGSWHDGRRHGFSWNIKNEIQRGLDICYYHGKCVTNNSFKYKIHSVNVGWEVTGKFHVDSQLYFIGLATR